MENNDFGKEFWTQRWKDHSTKWDIGYPSTPLKDFIDTLTNKELRILIPGCGNAYEAEYLFRNGFRHVFIADITEEPLQRFAERVPEFPKDQLLHADFFQLTSNGKWDLILEQTFFCAINPEMRDKYV
ncbi:MAG TPA: SAM-dependent methyltransferase, partial [Bacteroidia bacterium]|nr:SAM-dependent methyltransferase [Bacteroidia bacterium]